MPSLSRNSPSPGEGDGAGGALPPWTRGPLALLELSWWGRRLTTGMAMVTVVSMAGFTAVAATRAAGFNYYTKGAPHNGDAR